MYRQAPSRRVLIASSHPLFGQGLRRLLQEREGPPVEVVGVVSSIGETITALERHNPDLIIVDYDDEVLNRDEFLAHFVEGEQKLRVVLLSLQSGSEALIYDRRTMAASDIDDWLEDWNYATEEAEPPDLRSGDINDKDRRPSMKHLVIAGILVIISTVLLITVSGSIRILPEQASLEAVSIDGLLNLEFGIIAFLFSLIVVFMIYSIVVFRRKKGDEEDARHIEGSNKLEVAWTLAPLLTVLFIAYLGGQSLAEVTRPDPQALEINVIGSQWAWRFEYPDEGIVSEELLLPVDREALLHLWSIDVIHSFWVPEFRVKQDALPGGKENARDLRVTPIMVGDYKLRCAELCGLQHAYMLAPVRVVSQADYDAWVIENTQVSDDPVERGAQLSQQYGCLACHSTDGTTLVGPTWQGLYGSEVPLESGETVIANEEYLFQSIREPAAQIHAGFPNAMPPNIAEALTDEQIADIIAFIESLQ